MTASGDSPSRRARHSTATRRSGSTRKVAEWAIVALAALLIALVVRTFLFQAFYIPSASMHPTLELDDRVLVNKLSYRLHDVNRGDIVVFKAPESSGADAEDLVKRVVGLPGETIQARDGSVMIDGLALDEDYLPEGTRTERFGPTEIPAGAVYMMGDNRSGSSDSRSFGAVPIDDIVGRVFVRIWPPQRIATF